MRADWDRSSRAHAGQSRLELYIPDGPGAGASITGGQRVLSEEWLAADDLYHEGQLGRDQDRDVPVWCALIVRRRPSLGSFEVDGQLERPERFTRPFMLGDVQGAARRP